MKDGKYMELEVFCEKKVETKKTYLSLYKAISGGIMLCVVDERGNTVEGGSLIEFNTDGTISLCTGIAEEIGFKLSYRGAIEINPP